MPYRQWTSGQLVTAPDFQSYIQDQTVLRFASTAERDAAIPSPVNGLFCITTDTYTLWRRQSGAWRAVGATSGGVVRTDPGPFRTEAADVSVTTDATGLCSVAFQQPFTDCLGVMQSFASHVAGLSVILTLNSKAPTYFSTYMRFPDLNPIANTTVRLAYFAWGT